MVKYKDVVEIFAIVVFLIMFKGVVFAKRILLGSSGLHDKMLVSIMRSPIAFFDVTPPGPILNRFSKDMDD